nr:NAD(P)-binding protein [Nostoc mirabile]
MSCLLLENILHTCSQYPRLSWLYTRRQCVIIGSGFGGSVTALRLAQAGIHCLVLERGGRWSITPAQNTFATLRTPDGRCSWLSSFAVFGEPVPIDVYTGVLELLQEDGINVYAGAGVGGGSLVYNGVTYQPTRTNFERIFPKEISYNAFKARTSLALPGKNTNSTGIPVFVVSSGL